MGARGFLSVALFVLVLVARLVVASTAAADEGHAAASDGEARLRGFVRLRPVGAARAPIELTPTDAGYEGRFDIVNAGSEPAVVSRIAMRGDASDPRSPAKAVTGLVEGRLPATIPPGGSRRGFAKWLPERGGARARQLFGHVVVSTSEDASDDVALGVHAHVAGPFGPFQKHLLSISIGIPLFAALALLALRDRAGRNDAIFARASGAALGVQAMFAVCTYSVLLPSFSRADGNDGLQLVERVLVSRSWPLELAFGADGVSSPALAVVALVAFSTAFATHAPHPSPRIHHVARLVLAACVAGVLVAMDAVSFVAFMVAAAIAGSVLVEQRTSKRHVFLTTAVAALLVAAASSLAVRSAQGSLLVDGTKVSTTYALSELARAGAGNVEPLLFGVSVAKLGFLLVFVASLCLLAGFPFHGCTREALDDTRASTSALLAATLPTLGGACLLRYGCTIFAEGLRWASGVVVALGAVSAAYGALGMLTERDLRRFAAHASTYQTGFFLLGVGSLTPQGLTGALVVLSTRSLASALFLVVVGAVEQRARRRDLASLTGVGTQMPLAAAALSLAALGQAGALGAGGAWGPVLAVFGAMPNYPPLAVAAGLAFAAAGAATATAVGRLVFGKLHPSWVKSAPLEPFGGRFPDLTAKEALGVLGLLVLLLGVGLWPPSLASATAGTVRDLAHAVSPPGPGGVAAR